MRKITALTLSAAMVPALALGTVAFAEQTSGDAQADEQSIDDQGMERADEQDDELRAGEQYDDEQRAGEDRDDELRAGEERDDEQLAGQQDRGEQFMNRKPQGALFADDVIGKTVKTRGTGDTVGTIDDLVIGDDGRILGAVITTGGFLGLGGQEVGVGWDHMQHSMEDDDSVFHVDMDEETLKNAPELERD